jgi:RND superfamily putative drug exporter
MASGPQTDVKILATGLAAGILIDATVIRALLVPAVVSLFGRWNWWLPHPVAASCTCRHHRSRLPPPVPPDRPMSSGVGPGL